MGRSASRGVAVAVLLAVAGVGMVAVAPVASARPSVRVFPAHDLVDLTSDGQFVTVTWSGFPRNGGVYMRECQRGATDLASQCSAGGLYSTCGISCPGVTTLGLSDGSGSGSAVAQIAIGDINVTQRLEPIEGRTFTCDWEHLCSLFVMPSPSDLASAVEARIGFAKPATACPEDDTFVSGSGGASGFRYVWGWAPRVCGGDDGIGLQYVLRTARDAIDDYVAGVSDYAVSAVPLDGDQHAALEAGGRTVGYAPVAASALVFTYRVFDQRTGRQVTDLVLTPGLIAKIFTGQIRSWADPDIRKLNPRHAFPQLIGVVARGDACEETLTMTRWIWEHARREFIAGGRASGIKPNPFAGGPTDLLPSTGQINLVTGSRREALVVAKGDGDFGGSTSTWGLMGYLDSSIAAQYDLPSVAIRYPNGVTSEATSSAIERGVLSMTEGADGVLEPDVSIVSPRVWAMPTVSYMLVPHDARKSDYAPSAALAAALERLILYGVGKAAASLPLGYVPLPASLVRQARWVAGGIMKALPPLEEPEPPPPPPPPPPSGGVAGGGTTPPGSSAGSDGPGGSTVFGIPYGDPDYPVPPSYATEAPNEVNLPTRQLAASPAGVALPAIVVGGALSILVGLGLLVPGTPAVARARRLALGVARAPAGLARRR